MAQSNLAVERPYPYLPSDRIIESFIRIIRESGGPESIPGLSYDRPPLDERSGIEVLCRIDISESRRRNREFARCAICSPDAGKFAHGYLAWSPATGHVHSIGHECRDLRLHGAIDAALQSYRGRQELEEAREFLFDYLPTLESRLQAFNKLEPLCVHYRNLRSSLEKEAPVLFRALVDAAKHKNGELYVEDAGIQSDFSIRSSSGRRSRSIAILVHTLTGRQYITANTGVQFRFIEITTALRQLPSGLSNDDALIDAMAIMESNRQIVETSRKIRRTHDLGNRLIASLLHREQFLHTSNIAGIVAWASDERSSLEIGASFHPPFLRVNELMSGWTHIRVPSPDAASLIMEVRTAWELR